MRSSGTTNASVGKAIKAALATLAAAGPAEYIFGRGKLRVGRMWNLPKMHGKCWLTVDLDAMSRPRAVCAGQLHQGHLILLARLRLKAKRWISCASPSGEGWHFAYQIPKVHVGVRIALQLLMGSDPQREIMNLRRSLACPRFEVCCLFRNGAAP